MHMSKTLITCSSQKADCSWNSQTNVSPCTHTHTPEPAPSILLEWLPSSLAVSAARKATGVALSAEGERKGGARNMGGS